MLAKHDQDLQSTIDVLQKLMTANEADSDAVDAVLQAIPMLQLLKQRLL